MEKKTHNKGPYNVTIIYDSPPAPEVFLSSASKEAGKEKSSNLPMFIEEAVLFVAAFIILGGGTAFLWFSFGTTVRQSARTPAVVAEWKDPFLSVALEAKAAIVFDIEEEKTLYAQYSEAQLPLASLTKLLTALIATKTLGGDGIVTIDTEAVAEIGDSGLRVGERWRTDNLVAFTLMSSSNDGAVALARAVEMASSSLSESASPQSFSYVMNAWTEKIGLRQTYFLDAAGLDVSGDQSGAYGSAQDIAFLLAYILKHTPEVVEDTSYVERSFASLDGFLHLARNTNERVAVIPGIVASKTGFTDLAGGNLAIVFEAGPMRPIAVVVLGSSTEGRFDDVEALVGATIDYFRYR